MLEHKRLLEASGWTAENFRSKVRPPHDEMCLTQRRGVLDTRKGVSDTGRGVDGHMDGSRWRGSSRFSGWTAENFRSKVLALLVT